jgi:Fe-S-cluster-containing hydrogenase component 2
MILINVVQRFCILCELCVQTLPFFTVFYKHLKNHLVIRKRLPGDNID